MALSRDDILGLSDIQTKEIEVPVWDSTVYIRQLTRGQQDEFMRRKFGNASMKGFGKKSEIDTNLTLFGHESWVVAQGICDENGKRLFSNSDIEKLSERNGEAIGFIATEILEFSGMVKDIETLEEVLETEQEEVKN